MTIEDARYLFDNVISDHDNMDHYLNADATIIHKKEFNKSLITIMENDKHKLTTTQAILVQKFKIHNDNDESIENNEAVLKLSYSDKILQTKKK